MLGLRELMGRPEGWGRAQGREVYQRLLRSVEDHPGTLVFKISMKDVERVDISFASETVVELARRFRSSKGFCLIDLTDPDLIENFDAAAVKKAQPLLVWRGASARLIGAEPTRRGRLFPLHGIRSALEHAREGSRALPRRRHRSPSRR